MPVFHPVGTGDADGLSKPAENQIIENYCSGVYLSPEQVAQLLRDMSRTPKCLKIWRDFGAMDRLLC